MFVAAIVWKCWQSQHCSDMNEKPTSYLPFLQWRPRLSDKHIRCHLPEDVTGCIPGEPVPDFLLCLILEQSQLCILAVHRPIRLKTLVVGYGTTDTIGVGQITGCGIEAQ